MLDSGMTALNQKLTAGLSLYKMLGIIPLRALGPALGFYEPDGPTLIRTFSPLKIVRLICFRVGSDFELDRLKAKVSKLDNWFFILFLYSAG